MITEKEIINALKTLQNVCKKNHCEICPLRNGDESCGIIFSSDGCSHNNLEEWVVKSEEYPRVLLN